MRVVFSGDLGASHTPFLPAPKPPERADVLVLESTYGNRVHEDRNIRQLGLERIIDKALEDNGTVLIPAFSIGRTQELLYELEDILRRKMPSNHCTESSEHRGRVPQTGRGCRSSLIRLWRVALPRSISRSKTIGKRTPG